jgi:D-threonate/D-erythronate kinase
MMPPRLLIIADDLTGANDTGVQFAKQGIAVIVSIHHHTPKFIDDCEVLVVNTESRHLSADEAFRRVYDIAAQGAQHGIPQFYKKTDSTLRGNLGSELTALLAATNETELFFAPAYPKLHRTTRHGMQLVHGAPLHQSSFAHDSLNPARESSIAALIAQQTDLAVVPFASQVLRTDMPTIYVADAETDDELRAVARLFSAKKILAGSAGLAEFLPQMLPFSTAHVAAPKLALPMLVVNGSLHEASLRQVAHAAQNGWEVIEVTSKTPAAEIASALKNRRRVVLTTSPQFMNDEFAAHLAILVGQILNQVFVPVMAIFGGDTLMAIAEARGWTAFRPRTEFLPGVPLVQVCGQDDLLLLTKAGGFGAEDLLLQFSAA